MSPKTLTALSHFHGTARCPYGGGHPVNTDLILIVPDPTGKGGPLYAGCDACHIRAVSRIDAPASTSIEPQLRMLLVRAIAALTQPMHYTEVGALVQEIRAVIALAD